MTASGNGKSFRVPGSSFRVAISVLGFRVQDFGSGIDFRIPGLGLISGFRDWDGFQDFGSGMDFRISGLEWPRLGWGKLQGSGIRFSGCNLGTPEFPVFE